MFCPEDAVTDTSWENTSQQSLPEETPADPEEDTVLSKRLEQDSKQKRKVTNALKKENFAFLKMTAELTANFGKKSLRIFVQVSDD